MRSRGLLGRLLGRLSVTHRGPQGTVASDTRRPVGGSSRYAPRADGQPDPGEVVWAWVPYEEDPGQGKDRPVLVLDVRGEEVIALPMTSQDNTRDAAREARLGRHWFDVGSGGWDTRRRPSEVRLDRVLRLRRDAVRREGAALDRARFEAVLAAARPYL